MQERVVIFNIHADLRDFSIKERQRGGRQVNGDPPIFDSESFNGTGYVFSKAK